jgi:hypothetical protein
MLVIMADSSHPCLTSIHTRAVLCWSLHLQAKTVHAESIGDVGEFNDADFRKIKLTNKDNELFEKFAFASVPDTEKEIAVALYEMDNPPPEAPQQPKPGGCCSIL